MWCEQLVTCGYMEGCICLSKELLDPDFPVLWEEMAASASGRFSSSSWLLMSNKAREWMTYTACGLFRTKFLLSCHQICPVHIDSCLFWFIYQIKQWEAASHCSHWKSHQCPTVLHPGPVLFPDKAKEKWRTETFSEFLSSGHCFWTLYTWISWAGFSHNPSPSWAIQPAYKRFKPLKVKQSPNYLIHVHTFELINTVE